MTAAAAPPATFAACSFLRAAGVVGSLSTAERAGAGKAPRGTRPEAPAQGQLLPQHSSSHSAREA